MSPKDARTWDRAKFYKEITAAKKDIESLALDGILRKDYKQWTENGMKLGMSSVVKPLGFLAEKAATERFDRDNGNPFVAAVQDFMAARDLSMYAIMTTSTSTGGQFQRQLFLQAYGPAMDAAKRFGQDAAAELGLEKLNVEGIPEEGLVTQDKACYRRVWQQKEVGKSRKQVSPLIRQAMQ